MYTKTKERGWKENHGIQNTGIEDSKGKAVICKREILKMWENSITEHHDQPN